MARVLIVEDEALIAMMLGDWLEELGHVPIGPAATISAAMALIGAETFDAAILDLDLQGECSVSVATALTKKEIPFAIASGAGPGELQGLQAQAVLPKPYDFDAVRRTISALIAAV